MEQFNLDEIPEIEYQKLPCLRIVDKFKGKARFYGEGFNSDYLEHIRLRLGSNDLECDMNNHAQALNAMNVLYIDIDGKISDVIENVERANEMIGKLFVDAFIRSNGLRPVNVYIFTPTAFPLENGEYKIGVHALIVMDKEITKDERKSMYNTTRRAILDDRDICLNFMEAGIDVTAKTYEGFFDSKPLLSCQCLMPFAVKPGAKRNYKLINANDINTDADILIMPSLHTERNDEAEESDLEFSDEDVLPDLSDEDNEDLIETKSKLFKGTLAFVHSLRYLCKDHIMWKYLADHELRIKHIIKPLYYWLVMVTTIEDPWSIKGDVLKMITKSLAFELIDLVIMTNPRDKIENTYSKLYKDIEGCCALPFQEGGYYDNFLNDEVIRAVPIMKDKDDQGFIPSLKRHVGTYYPNLDKNDRAAMIKALLKDLRNIKQRAEIIYSGFAKFVQMIMNGFTEEIRPFAQEITLDKIKKGWRKDDNVRGYYSFDSYRSDQLRFEIYEETVKTWLRMFVCVMYYETGNTFESIRKAISAIASPFVRNVSDGKETYPIFYNVRQTVEACAFSYNQWIPDRKGELILDWFVTIYLLYIEEEFQSHSKVSFQKAFFDLMRTVQPMEVPPKADVKVLNDIRSSLKSLKNNILVTSGHKYISQKPPEKLPSVDNSRWHSMRNCILEFVTKEIVNRPDVVMAGKKLGDVIAHYNNFDKYMDCTSNIYYNENYSKNNPIYRRVLKMFEEIYLTEPETEYMKMIFSCVFHSIGSRDQVYQFYGTGAEGKSLMNNAISMTIGYGDEPIPIQTTPGYKYDICQLDTPMRIVNGLATSMDVRFLMTENKSTHDSGGAIELRNRRFCTVAEPNVKEYGCNLNVSFCKRVTGESIISARQIKKASQTFIPKVLLIIQTNDVLGYTEDNDAVRRRFAVVNHRAKFVTEALLSGGNKRGVHSIRHKADPSLSASFKSDPAYWEALFQVLLPYAQEFIRRGYTALSDIPKPESMLKWFEISRLKSTGLVGWFAKNFVEQEGNAISAYTIIKKIMDQDKIERDNGNPILDASMMKLTGEQRRTQIANVIAARFAGQSLFKLRKEFWNGDLIRRDAEIDLGDGNFDILSLDDLEVDGEGITCDEDIEKWFEHDALTSLAEISNLKGAYVIDYGFIKIVKEERLVRRRKPLIKKEEEKKE